MAKIKLTKNELKKQKDALKRYTRYLPTLELKKQQLLAEIRRVHDEIHQCEGRLNTLKQQLAAWVAVFAEDVDIASLFSLKQILTDTGNIAGINIPLFVKVEFEDNTYDLMAYPLWVDTGIHVTKEAISLQKELEILKEQETLIQEELRTTIQRINLFDKVMIPRSKENIRKIRIFMGDQETAAVVRGKISKTKIEKKKLEQRA
ncbi:MAG: V-type ATP synthase subunit D [Candidatus Marinimicrobia bacterium]|nr:V-type ATP synthase subunit D [Candidatus Neomarinimicrobiota bacterium]